MAKYSVYITMRVEIEPQCYGEERAEEIARTNFLNAVYDWNNAHPDEAQIEIDDTEVTFTEEIGD